MKLLFLFLVALTLTSCGKPKEALYKDLGYKDDLLIDPATSKGFSGIARDYYKDNKLKAEFPIKNGKFHGTVKEWHANGQASSETTFENGERVGANREWTADGKLYRERVYDHDKIVSEKNHGAAK